MTHVPSLGQLMLVVIAFIPHLSANSQFTLDWAQVVDAGPFSGCVDIQVDGNGDLIAAYVFTQTIDVDPGPGVVQYTPVGSFDLALAKYDPQGMLVWSVQLGSSGEESIYGIALDDQDNIYVFGRIGQSLDADPGPGTALLSSQSGNNAFLAKYDPQGVHLWSGVIRGTYNVDEGGIRVRDQVVYVHGSASSLNGPLDLDVTLAVASFSDVNSNAMFWAEYDLDAAFLDGAVYGYVCRGRVVDPVTGHSYVAGVINQAEDVDPGPGVTTLTPDGPNGRGVLLAYDDAGALLWTALIEGGQNQATDLIMDANGDVYLMGYTLGATLDLDPGPGVFPFTTAYLAKYTAAGTLAWASSVPDQPNDVVLSPGGNLLIADAGWLGEFSPSGASGSYTSDPLTDGFRDLAFNAAGDLFLSGSVQDSMDVDLGPGTTWLFPLSNNVDPFLARYSYTSLVTGLAGDPGNGPDHIRLFPNPASDRLTVRSCNLTDRIQAVRLFNNLGQQVFTAANIPADGGTDFVLDVSQYDAGVYHLSVSTNYGVQTQRLVVE